MRNSNLALDESTTLRNFLDYFQVDEDDVYQTTPNINRQAYHHSRNKLLIDIFIGHANFYSKDAC